MVLGVGVYSLFHLENRILCGGCDGLRLMRGVASRGFAMGRVSTTGVLRAAVLKAAMLAASVLALPAGLAAADDRDTCRQAVEGPNGGGGGQPDQAKARLFERSAEPVPAPSGVTRATGKLALDALAAPGRFARWIASRTSGGAETPN
jgi:hypothetical protein